jgi:hypothetical protein
MGTGSFPGVENGRGLALIPHPLLVPRSIKQGRAIPLLSLRAFVAFNPLPLLFKALLHGQKDRVFFSGRLIYVVKRAL